MSMPNIQATTHTVTRQALTEHLEALIPLIEGAQDTHFYSEDDEHPVGCVYCEWSPAPGPPWQPFPITVSGSVLVVGMVKVVQRLLCRPCTSICPPNKREGYELITSWRSMTNTWIRSSPATGNLMSLLPSRV